MHSIDEIKIEFLSESESEFFVVVVVCSDVVNLN